MKKHVFMTENGNKTSEILNVFGGRFKGTANQTTSCQHKVSKRLMQHSRGKLNFVKSRYSLQMFYVVTM